MKKNSCYWCWWLSRYLWFIKYDDNLHGIFEDVAGARFRLSPTLMEKLKDKEV